MALIMIFDGERDGRSLLARVLGGRGHEVHAFDEEGGAAAWLEANVPDLLILDLDTGLGGSKALLLLDMIKQRSVASKVIATTGNPARESLVRMAGAHVDGVLIKPVELDELEDLVNRVLEAAERGAGGVGERSGPHRKEAVRDA